MGTSSRRHRTRAVTGMAALLFLFLSGCSGPGAWRMQAPDSETDTPRKDGSAPTYYDFGDVLIPSELKLDPKASFIFQTPNLTAGVLALHGMVDMSSLIRFFEINMGKDNWQPVSSFKSVRTIMLYKKENRWCVVNISEKGLSTHVEIWVAPTTHGVAGGGLLKEEPLEQ